MHDCTCQSSRACPIAVIQLAVAAFPLSSCVHLVIARAPSVELPSDRAYVLCQAALVGCVDVLVPGHNLECAGLPLLLDLLEPLHNLLGLIVCDDACFGQRLCIGLAPLHMHKPSVSYQLLKSCA